MTTISEAFVTIRPDTKDFGKEAESGIQSAAGSIAKSGLFLGAAAGVAIAGALGKGLSDAINVEKANDKLSAQLGLTAEESERVGGLAGDLFADAYGGSLEEVNAAIAGVGRNIVELGSTSTGEIKDIAAQALDLAAVMDEDVGRVTRGVGQLMRNNLAPDAQAAFDIIARAQSGAAGTTGDLIDTIEEYSSDFVKVGLTGEQAMGMIEAAMEAGARNTDLAADAIREFGIRAVDGSELTRESFQKLGLDADAMSAAIAAGGPTAQTAMSTVIQALSGLEDPLLQQIIGVGLFGTRFEELGPKIIGAMDPAVASLDNVAGASGRLGDTLNTNLGTSIEELQRKAMTMLSDGMMPVAKWINETGLPAAEDFFGAFKEGLTGDQAAAITADMNSIGIAVTSVPLEEEMSGWEQAAFTMGQKIDELGTDFQQFQEEDAGPALDKLGKAWELVSPIVEREARAIAEKAEESASLTGNALNTVVDLLGGDYQGAWTNGKETVAEAWRVMGLDTATGTSEVDRLLDEMNRKTDGRMGTFAGLMRDWGAQGSNWLVDEIAKTPGRVVGILNDLISLVNGVIGRINSALEFNVSFPGKDLPGAVNALGIPDTPGFSVGFDPPDIPMIPGLASGGIVRARPGGTLVNVGEGGFDEAVVPLDGRGAGGLRDVITYGPLQLVLPNARNSDEMFRELDRIHAW